jgi:hemoglobin-like flavoprotein
MTPETQTLVRESFAKVVPIAPAAAAMFYDRLFALDPTLRPLFKGDMTEQGKKLMAMIGTAVANLHKLDTIVPAVQDLGRRHAGYGVRPEHYATVAEALLWTLGQGLGDEFTPATKVAWVEAYTILSAVMQQAAGQA